MGNYLTTPGSPIKNIGELVEVYDDDIKYKNDIWGPISEIEFQVQLPPMILVAILNCYNRALVQERYEIIEFIKKFKLISKWFNSNVLGRIRFNSFTIYSEECCQFYFKVLTYNIGFRRTTISFNSKFTLVNVYRFLDMSETKFTLQVSQASFEGKAGDESWTKTKSLYPVPPRAEYRNFVSLILKFDSYSTLGSFKEVLELPFLGWIKDFSVHHQPPKTQGLFAPFTNLRSLALGSHLHFEILSTILDRNPSLQSLSIHLPPLEDNTQVIDKILSLRDLTKLKVEHSNIAMLNYLLQKNSTITDLTFPAELEEGPNHPLNLLPLRRLTTVQARNICDLWSQKNNSVEILTLELRTLLHVEQFPFHMVRQLSLTFRPVESNSNSLATLLEQSMHMVYLSVRFDLLYPFSAECANRLIRAVQNNFTIECLILKQYQFYNYALKGLLRHPHPSLKTLEFDCNEVLSENSLNALMLNTNIESFSFPTAYLTFEVLIELLTKNHTLRNLQFSKTVVIHKEDPHSDKKIDRLLNCLIEKESQFQSLNFIIGKHFKKLKKFFLESSIQFYTFQRKKYEIDV